MWSEIMFTGTATLTRVVDRGEQERLRAATGLAGRAERVAAHVRQRLEEIERADRQFHNCRPARLKPHRCSRRSPKVCGSCWLSL